MNWPLGFKTLAATITLSALASAQPDPAPAPEEAEPKAPGARPDTAAEPSPAPAPPTDTADEPTTAEPEAVPDGEAPEGEAPPEGTPKAPPPGLQPQLDDVPDEDEEPELPITPSAADSLGGHFLISAHAALANPSGRLAQHVPDQSGWGAGFGGDVGFGVSRHLALGLFGQWIAASSDDCSDCTSKSLAFGPFVRFHLVQGLRFDPWLAFQFGYRSAQLDDGQETLEFKGFDWARVQVGGDWYPSANFGIGPFLEVDSGGFFDRPEESGNLRSHWYFLFGARLVLDIPGKP